MNIINCCISQLKLSIDSAIRNAFITYIKETSSICPSNRDIELMQKRFEKHTAILSIDSIQLIFSILLDYIAETFKLGKETIIAIDRRYTIKKLRDPGVL